MPVLPSPLEKNLTVQKPPPPQVGFNNNVKHRGRVFHIQTEDSGVTHPHVTTHLFVDGGRIIKSERSDYSEFLGASDLPTLLRKRMKEQHKAMFVALRRGQLDPLIDKVFGEEPTSSARPDTISTNGKSPSSFRTGSPPMRPRSRPPVSFQRPRAPSLLGLEEPRAMSGQDGSKSELLSADAAPTSLAPRPALVQATDPSSLYGEGNVGEKSLDDVILSYITDDLVSPEKN